ncbi:unnamed protein product, partial [marine sediment metagenome]
MAFDWGSMDNWVDIGKIIAGGLSAKKGSDMAMDMGDLKNLWMFQNPDENNPYMTSTLERNDSGGTVRNTQFTPQIQAVFDALIGNLSQGPTQYNNSFGDLGNASANYQRSRKGLDPVAYDGSNTGNYGLNLDVADQQPDYGGGESPINAADSQEPGFDRGYGGGGYSGGSIPGSTGASGSPSGDGSALWDAFSDSGYNPFAWRDNYNATDSEKLFGQNDIGSIGGMNAPGAMEGRIPA